MGCGIIAVMSAPLLPPALAAPLQRLLAAHGQNLAVWRELAQRFRQDRLGVTASSLTFTTVLALVPFFTVALSLFTAFPAFGRLRDELGQWLVDQLIPASIADSVLEHLGVFASKASQMGVISLAVFGFTTLSLLLTVDHTLNAIWRVRQPRPLSQRLLVYWAALTLGPLLMGASLAITSYVAAQSGLWLAAAQGDVARHAGQGLLALLKFVELALPVPGITLLYHYVPNTHVRWRHALAGGLFATLGLALLRWGMGIYLLKMPGYSLIYGAFAAVPVLLLWMYLSWLIVLFGAVIAAYLPALEQGIAPETDAPGRNFELAASALQALAAARRRPPHGLSQNDLARALQTNPLHLAAPLQTLCELGWLAALPPESETQSERYILLAHPPDTPLAPLAERLLLPASRSLPAPYAGASLQTLIDHAPPAAP